MGFEITFLNMLQQLHTPLLDKIMIFFTRLGNNGIIWVVLSVALLIIPKTRKLGIVLLVSLFIQAVFCNLVFKPLLARIRPCDVNEAITLLISHPDDYSFPSGHTSAAFATLIPLYLLHERKMAWPVLLLSLLIAFSRMYLYVHFPTDVLGGALLGIVSGWVAVKLLKNRLFQQNDISQSEMTPSSIGRG